MEDTIDKVGTEGNLTPKQIQMLNAKQGIQRKNSIGVKASLMKTKSNLKNKLK